MGTRQATFGDVLRAAREGKGLSVPELARKSGLAKQAVYFWESGEREPSLRALRKIAAGLGVRPGDLLDGLPPLKMS